MYKESSNQKGPNKNLRIFAFSVFHFVIDFIIIRSA